MKTTNSILNDEKEVVRLLRESDERAFNVLFRFYSTRLYHFANSYLKSADESKEIVQETFIRIWERRESLDIEQSFSGFLFTVAHRMVLNRIRKQKTENQYKSLLLKNDTKGIPETENNIISSELEKAKQDALFELPPRRRIIFEMIREQGMTYKEVAEKLNISVKTVEAQMAEAMKHLRARLSL